MTFIIYALPRSRTAWMAHWLNGGATVASVCHDLAPRCASMRDFFAQFNSGMVGTVETAAIIGWRVIQEVKPGLKVAVIRRPVAEVINSLARFDIHNNAELYHRAALLDEVSALPGVLTLNWDALSDLDSARLLWGHLRGEGFDPEYWDRCCDVNIQINVYQMQRYLATNHSRVAELRTSVITAQNVLAAGGDLCQALN